MADLIVIGYPDEPTAALAGLPAPGTSALFLMVEKVTPDKAIGALSHYGGSVLKSSPA